MKLGELYGETDPNTYDWTDGLIAMAVRKFSKELNKHGSGDDRPSTSGSIMTDHTRVGTSFTMKIKSLLTLLLSFCCVAISSVNNKEMIFFLFINKNSSCWR